jgi:hypothetical protein
MSLTDYHAKYIAFELTRRFPSDSPERLAGAVASAQVDLNPHQVDAALFAFASPLSKGALLADEVGLGKTIEAGLVLSQRWAERRRRILVITPSNLRKQWFQESEEFPGAIRQPDPSAGLRHPQGQAQARHELTDAAEFLGDATFRLHRAPPDAGTAIPLGLYELPRRSGEAHLYRLNHPLAEALLAKAKGRNLSSAEIRFDYGRHPGKISLIEPLIGRSGWLILSLFRVESLDQGEDHLIFAAVTDDGEPLDPEAAARLMTVPGSASPLPAGEGPGLTDQALGAQTDRQRAAIERQVSERNARFFEAEAQKLDGWADDLKVGLEREIKEMDRQIREARRAASAAVTLDEKLAGQRQIKAQEAQRNQKRRSLFDPQDQVDDMREKFSLSFLRARGLQITSSWLACQTRIELVDTVN